MLFSRMFWLTLLSHILISIKFNVNWKTLLGYKRHSKYASNPHLCATRNSWNAKIENNTLFFSNDGNFSLLMSSIFFFLLLMGIFRRAGGKEAKWKFLSSFQKVMLAVPILGICFVLTFRIHLLEQTLISFSTQSSQEEKKKEMGRKRREKVFFPKFKFSDLNSRYILSSNFQHHTEKDR